MWSRDHSAPPTTAINLDHSLNYLLHSADRKVEPLERPSSSTSSSSLISSLHTTDLTLSQQLLNHPPSSVADNSVAQSHPLEPHPPAVCNDTGVQTIKVIDTAVQTDQCGVPVVPSVSSHHSVTTMTSSEFDHKMEHMMATALLNAKDTVNTIEALSQSLLMKSVSRESSLMTLQQPLTSTQCVANNQAVANSQHVANTPRVTTIQEPHHSPQGNSNQMDTGTHVTSSGHTPGSHANHVITSQHNYTLYNTGHHNDTSLYFNR